MHATRRIALWTLLALAASFGWAVAAEGETVALAPAERHADIWLRATVDLPAGEIRRAWTLVSAEHEFVLYVNGQEAGRSQYGRVASQFRLRDELIDLARYLRSGRNTFAVRVHRWSPGVATFSLEGEVQIEDAGELKKLPLRSDATWRATDQEAVGWNQAEFDDRSWPATEVAGLARPANVRVARPLRDRLAPPLPPPLADALVQRLPAVAEMSDWGQQVVFRDSNAVRQRLLEVYQTALVADAIVPQLCQPNTHMGDSFSMNGVSIGNGSVWTSMGPYPFTDTGYLLGPEYQMPVQWNPGSTFAGIAARLVVDGRDAGLRDQWLWKIRQTDVVATAAASPDSPLVFYTLTFAPPGTTALVRIYAVANRGNEPVEHVSLVTSMGGTAVEGRFLTAEVRHDPLEAGDSNTRRLKAGLVEEAGVTLAHDEASRMSTIQADLGAIKPGQCLTRTFCAVTWLSERNAQPVEANPDEMLARIAAADDAMLCDTVRWWRDYMAASTTLEAPGDWGQRVADLIDDEKVLVQTQQFGRTGAVGPMSFFSDQWIRDACGPVKTLLRTGKFENARRILDYHYTASVGCRKILNWLPMDIDVTRDWPAIEDWSQITMNHADRHANCEVPSWLILQHYWYFRYTGDLGPIRDHWEYLKRCLYGQFDNEADHIFRPDFKLPFHGDETYIYAGGEALWTDRYDLQQSSYVHGGMYSADSSFELVAAADALAEMGHAIGAEADVARLQDVARSARAKTEEYYWRDDLGMYAPGMSMLFPGQVQAFPMANINANVLWSGYLPGRDAKAESNAVRMFEYLMEDSGVLDPIVGYDVTVGMLQGQGLYSAAAVNHPWAEKAFYALLMITGDTGEYSEWMAPGHDFQTMYRANRLRPWEGGINLDAILFYLTGFEPDAPGGRLVLTPRLPTGVYSPIHWDRMTVRGLALGDGQCDLSVQDIAGGKGPTREYTISSRLSRDVSLELTAVLPFARIQSIRVNGRPAPYFAQFKWQQGLAAITTPLEAGKTVQVVVEGRPTGGDAVALDLKPFSPPPPEAQDSDIVIFTQQPPQQDRPALWQELSQKFQVTCLDSRLPVLPVQFQAALLDGDRPRTKALVLDEQSMTFNRKASFWEDPAFDELLGRFLRAGGVVMEWNSGNPTSKWLAKTLGDSHFDVDPRRQGQVMAADQADAASDADFRWLDELQAEGNGKWSGYWAGDYEMPYLDGGPVIRDRALIWGRQEQPHGSMQYTFKTVPGKDHLVRVRTWPRPKKGFMLLVQVGDAWREIETVWAPIPDDPASNGWEDVYLKMPAEVVTGERTTFRLKAPPDSNGGIGVPGYESTGAARVWIRDGLETPSRAPDSASRLAAALGLPDQGLVAVANGTISFEGFQSPYRILGDSQNAALILKRVGEGLYIKSTVRVETSFSTAQLAGFIERVLDPAARQAVEHSAMNPAATTP